MADLLKNAISLTVRDRAKWTKIWDHKGYFFNPKVVTIIATLVKITINMYFFKNAWNIIDLALNY